MRKQNPYICWGLTAFAVICGVLVFYDIFFQDSVLIVYFRKLVGILAPVSYGFVLAYVLTPVVNWLERKLFPDPNKRGMWPRALCILITWAVVALFFYVLLSILLPQLYQSLVSLAQSSPDRRLSIRVNFILDEFGNLPMIKDMDRMITASRSRGMKFLLLLQDRSQLEHRYGKEMASTIMSNCGNIMYLNGRDLSLIRDLSMMAGTDASGKAIVSTSRLQRLDKEKGEVFILRDRMYPYISTLPFATAYSQFAISEPELPSHTRIEVPVFDIEEDFDPFWKLNASNGYHVHVEDVSGDGRETTENDGRTTSNNEELTDEQRADMIDEILRMLSSDDDD